MTWTAISAGSWSSSDSTLGARRRASGRSSAAKVRSTTADSGGSPRRRRVLALDAALPARMTARASERLGAGRSPTMAGSSPTRVREPEVSPSSAMRRRVTSLAVVATRSRISRASRDSLATRATDGVSGMGLRRGFEAAAEDAAEANENAAGDIGGGHGEKEKLGVVEDAVDESADENDDERRVGFGEADAFEAVVAPGADHEEAEQKEETEPGDGERPPGDGFGAGSPDDGGDHGGGGGDGEADEIFAVGAAGIQLMRKGLNSSG